jgi:hypothetical protein
LGAAQNYTDAKTAVIGSGSVESQPRHAFAETTALTVIDSGLVVAAEK